MMQSYTGNQKNLTLKQGQSTCSSTFTQSGWRPFKMSSKEAEIAVDCVTQSLSSSEY